jgi:hypothetical protein
MDGPRRTSRGWWRLYRAIHPTCSGRRQAFLLDEATVQRGLNFTLTTTLGDLDLLGEVTGGGTYEDLRSDTVQLQLFGAECLCLGLERLIHVKRAAGRPKDFEVIAELEAILEEQGRGR